MALKVSRDISLLQHFKQSPWAFQQTYETSKEAERFTAALMALMQPKATARVFIDEIVFEPKNLNEFLNFNGIAASEYALNDACIVATGVDIPCLLQATWNDWIDFLFVVEDSPICLYADHDEWTTVFAKSQEDLDRCIALLKNACFTKIESYIRF